jgi:hypothetical protein
VNTGKNRENNGFLSDKYLHNLLTNKNENSKNSENSKKSKKSFKISEKFMNFDDTNNENKNIRDNNLSINMMKFFNPPMLINDIINRNTSCMEYTNIHDITGTYIYIYISMYVRKCVYAYIYIHI